MVSVCEASHFFLPSGDATTCFHPTFSFPVSPFPSFPQMFTVKCSDGVIATSFKEKDKVYIGPDKLLPMSRFINPP